MYDRAILRAADVCHLLNISLPTLYRWIRLCRFPKGFPYGPHTVGWTRDTVETWISKQASSAEPSK